MSFFKELKEDIVQSVNELSDTIEEKVSDEETARKDIAEKPADSTAAKKKDEEVELELKDQVRKEIESFLENDSKLSDSVSDGGKQEKSGTKNDKNPVSKDNRRDKKDKNDRNDRNDKNDKKASKDVKEVKQEKETADSESVKEPVPDMALDESDELAENMMIDIASKEVRQEEKTMNLEEDKDLMVDMGADDENSVETTVITKGTTINGGIKSDTSLLVKGVIEGDVECLGKLTIMGRVAGNSLASEIYVNTPRLEGNLESKGSVKIDVGTVVLGNISSASVVVAGAVKGDIDVNGPVIIDSTAVVKGTIAGKSIQINSGAVVDGACSMKYADVDLDTLFD